MPEGTLPIDTVCIKTAMVLSAHFGFSGHYKTLKKNDSADALSFFFKVMFLFC